MTAIFIIVWVHFVADFILQTDQMALRKSSSNLALSIHVIVYSLPFIPIFGLKYAAINGGLHFVTDYVTSRCTKHLWTEGKRHAFFVVIGFDQAVHLSCLIATLKLGG